MGITQHQVNEICNHLHQDGQPVKIREVRKALGDKGSFSTLGDMIKKWEKEKIEAIDAAYQLGEEVQQALLADVGRAMKKMKGSMQTMIDQNTRRFNELQAILRETESEMRVLKECRTQAEDTANKAKGATYEARAQAAKMAEEKERWQAKYHEEATKLAVLSHQFETLQQQYATRCQSPTGKNPKEGK